ncbi:GNAT family N-acetyltransferase [Streptococcus gallinaceus]|uniref:RimJ/RimL family protein N-acetyltransferase n=1 Tax=Streptococcus gallinaceus TaxID=165758 RepID=A0ABV2JKM1_9STRE
MNYIETERLVFRSWKSSDFDDFLSMNQDPEVMRYLPNFYSIERAKKIFQLIQKEFENYDYSLFAVETKENGQFIGYVGLHHTQLACIKNEIVEIGWRLKREFRAKGYATEAAQACLKYAFTELKLQEVYTFIAEGNIPSKNIMRKVGMEFVQFFSSSEVNEDDDLYCQVLYKISKELYIANDDKK